MKSTLRLAAVAAVLSVGFACSPPPNNDKCAGVTCPAGQLCDPNDGTCKGGGTGGGGGATGGGSGGGVGGGVGGGGGACSPVCADPTPVCLGTTCVECVDNTTCPATKPQCDTATNTCVASDGGTGGGAGGGTGGGNDGGTGGGTGGGDAGTTDGGAPGETCGNPINITLTAQADGGQSATIQADTTNAANDTSGSCAGTGPDLVYHVNLASQQRLTLTIAGDAGYTPVAYIRSTPCTQTADLACNTAGTTASAAATVPAGDYFLFVDGFGGSRGQSTVTVTATNPPPAPANDKCPGTALTFNASGVATASGDTTNATNDSDGGVPSCSPSAQNTGPDVVYSFSLTQSEVVTATVTPTGTPATLDPAVSILNGCGVPVSGELACGAAPATVSLLLGAGTYYVWVDSRLQTSGPFNLTVTAVVPAANDLCNTPVALFKDGGVQDSVVGSTKSASNNYSGSCTPGGSTAGDVVYAFSTSAASKFTAEVQPGTNGYHTELYLRQAAACQTDGGLAARDGGATDAPGCYNGVSFPERQALTVASLPAGSYLLFVDGYQASSGDFTLNARIDPLDPASANESCATAKAVTLTGGIASVEGNSRDAGNDAQGSCSANSGAGSADLVYSFTTPATSSDGGVNARATLLTRNLTEYSPAVYLRSDCADAGTELGCAANASATTGYGTVALTGLKTASTYFVWVDSASATARAGAFDLQLDVQAAGSAANDLCTGAVALTRNTSVAGTTVGANPDFDTAQYTGGNCTNSGLLPLPGADIVYSYTTTTAGPFTVTVQPVRGYDPAIAVMQGNCNAGSCVDLADNAFTTGTETLTINGLASTTYYIVVDSYTNTTLTAGRGGFIISVQ